MKNIPKLFAWDRLLCSDSGCGEKVAHAQLVTDVALSCWPRATAAMASQDGKHNGSTQGHVEEPCAQLRYVTLQDRDDESSFFLGGGLMALMSTDSATASQIFRSPSRKTRL